MTDVDREGASSNPPALEGSALEITLLGERFRLKPAAAGVTPAEQEDHDRAVGEAMRWVSRQLVAAESRMGAKAGSRPKAHHVALLAMVELAYEAMQERNRHARALDGLLHRLEKLKSSKSNQKGAPSTAPAAMPESEVELPVREAVLAPTSDKSWMQDDHRASGAPAIDS